MKGRACRSVLGLLALLAGFGAARSQNGSASLAPAAPMLSPVILAENPQVVQRFAVDDGRVRAMVDSELMKLTSADDIGQAWRRLGIVPSDTVGIKITTMGGPLLSTHRALVQAICDGLQAAGVSPSRIIIWDKSGGQMMRAGYVPTEPDADHVAIASVFPGTGTIRILPIETRLSDRLSGATASSSSAARMRN